MKPLLKAQNLTVAVRKGKKWITVVDHINFDIKQGEIIGIVGESGCGKTLTALSIMGLLGAHAKIAEGELLFKTVDLQAISRQEKQRLMGYEIAMVFQEPMTALNPLMKIGEQLAEPLRLHGITDRKMIHDKVIEILHEVELSEPERLMQAYPHQLSGGMRQRVMIAAAVICRPKLLIADEATTALDVTVQAQILQLLKKLNQTMGLSILFISHDLGVIRAICDKVMVMYAGKIVEQGSVGNIFYHPLHEYTKGLFGAIAVPEKKGLPLSNIPGKVPAVGEKRLGCPFALRCPKVQDICLSAFPSEIALGENHSVNCALVEADREVEYVQI
ncbi:ABC transporter ATP-binding protein [Scatolibacter rhodanostii]|uniref:ABC transporter ATP-binding protein n=1 Tax=Scatolibacter rhodanostii TaxID=2014781 RepID=UPI000C069B55|nr:ABC transporter ATP-binding protein [Scatolibacter rhodanostii]